MSELPLFRTQTGPGARAAPAWLRAGDLSGWRQKTESDLAHGGDGGEGWGAGSIAFSMDTNPIRPKVPKCGVGRAPT